MRNLALDHSNSAIFERNYLSRQIRYDVQAAYLGSAPNTELIRAAGRMSRWMDPSRPRKLTGEQKESIRREPQIQELYGCKGLTKLRNRTIKARERELLEEVKARHDRVAPVQAIQRQLSGLQVPPKEIPAAASPVQHVFTERSRIAEAFSSPPSTFRGADGFRRRVQVVQDMISLCSLQERHDSKKLLGRRIARAKLKEDLMDCDSKADLHKRGSPGSDAGLFPLKCKPFQCPLCLGCVGLPLDDRCRDFASKFSLQRHAMHDHFRMRDPGRPITCTYPHPDCKGVTLDNLEHFLNHAELVHEVKMMSDKESARWFRH